MEDPKPLEPERLSQDSYKARPGSMPAGTLERIASYLELMAKLQGADLQVELSGYQAALEPRPSEHVAADVRHISHVDEAEMSAPEKIDQRNQAQAQGDATHTQQEHAQGIANMGKLLTDLKSNGYSARFQLEKANVPVTESEK